MTHLSLIAYLPVEFRFPPGESFKHFGLKWDEYAAMSCVPCTDGDVAERLQAISKRLFVGLDGAGYGRCDIRMNDQGELFMLEINPNCGLFYPPDAMGSADFILYLHVNPPRPQTLWTRFCAPHASATAKRRRSGSYCAIVSKIMACMPPKPYNPVKLSSAMKSNPMCW